MKKVNLIDEITNNATVFFSKQLNEKEWDKASIVFSFTYSGSSKFIFSIDNTKVNLSIFDLDDTLLESIDEYFKTRFIQSQKILGYKADALIWNKAIFEYSKDGTLKSEYVWDNAQKVEEEKGTAYHFCHWLQGRLTTMMFEESGFDKKKWDRAIGEFWVNDQDISFVGKAFNKRNQELPININLESWDVRKALIEHFEITNNGILKDFWQPWNKLTIRVFQDDYFRESEHTDYGLDNEDGIAVKIEGLPVEYN